MDLGIKGRKAIVCASSRGLGKACARALAENGCEVVVNGRDQKKLEAAANEIAGLTGGKIIPVAADVATPEGQKALLAAWRLRHKMPDAPRPYRTLGYPLVPAVFVLVAAWLVLNTLWTSPVESTAGLLFVALGLPAPLMAILALLAGVLILAGR